MNWYLAKVVYRIISGNGDHTPQFDEQLRLLTAASKEDAFEKAVDLGIKEQECFTNIKQEKVTWQFINVSELIHLHQLSDGTELYSRIHETDDAEAYLNFVNKKAEYLLDSPNIHFPV